MSSTKVNLHVRHDHDGSHSTLRILEQAEVNGNVWPVNSDFILFSTNPGIYGLPNETIEVGGVTYSVEDLLDVLGQDWKDEIDVLLSGDGEILVSKKL